MPNNAKHAFKLLISKVLSLTFFDVRTVERSAERKLWLGSIAMAWYYVIITSRDDFVFIKPSCQKCFYIGYRTLKPYHQDPAQIWVYPESELSS